jgi:uncharacterized protein (DUF1501 family)
MTKLTRRSFLQKLGAAGILGALYNLDTLTLSSTLAHAAGEDYRALVCVFLFGGNDGNNTIIPASGGDYAAYSAIRRDVAIPAQNLVPLASAAGDTAYGLHPQLAPLGDIWDGGAMAVLLNVGTLAEPTTKSTYSTGRISKPDGLFSHYDQQAQWQGTGPVTQIRSGWGGRIADRLTGEISQTSVPMMISVAGDSLYATGNVTNAIAIPSTGSFTLTGSTNSAAGFARRAALDRLFAVDRDSMLVKGAGDVIARALENSAIIDQIITSNDASAIQGLFDGQDNDFARQMLQVAKLIEARTSLGARRQIFFVSLQGFDTHFAQVGAQSSLFAQLAPALKAFYDATVVLGVASNVTTFTLSDFGRTFQPNSSGGTDHGWGSHHFIIGGAVRGRQFYGSYPILALDGPDDAGKEGCWIPTVSVDQYAATLATWFGVPASDLPLVVPNIGRFAGANLGFMA